MNLYFLRNYSNYFNRQVKRLTASDLYEPVFAQNNADKIIGTQEGIRNFNYGNGINTEVVVNDWSSQYSPDYCLAYNSEGYHESSWFVIEADYLRNGQYRMILRRDVIVENLAKVTAAPAFIEKATPTDINDPAIFNKENLRFNQIKTDELLLKDKSKCAWVVGYVAKNRDYGETGTEFSVEYPLQGAADIEVSNLSDWEYVSYVNSPRMVNLKNTFRVRTNTSEIVNQNLLGNANIVTGLVYDGNKHTKGGYSIYIEGTDSYKQTSLLAPNASVVYSYERFYYLDEAGRQLVDKINESLFANRLGLQENYEEVYGRLTAEQTVALLNENGKILYESSTGTFYRINVSLEPTISYGTDEIPKGSWLFVRLNESLSDISSKLLTGTADANSYSIDWEGQRVLVSLTSVTGEISATITNNRFHLEDSPYDMFAIPYAVDEPVTLYRNGSEFVSAASSVAALMMAIEMTQNDSNYDLQLLPYCPVSYLIKNDVLDLTGLDNFSAITDNDGNVLNVVLWARTSQGSFEIPVNIPQGATVLERKINSETKLYRLCSPNYSGASDFNAEMNNGVEFVNVDYTYKPYGPYIHLNINYKGLYGYDANDSRGLICGGDFSLPQISDAWETYQLQNKNYQAMFDREIEHLEVNNAVQRKQEIATALAGTFAGGAQGGMTGNIISGGNPAAMIGGMIGGVAVSGAAGAYDVYLNDKLRAEGMDYTKDRFEMSLQNIQALPYSLSKTSAITYNNKIFPFIEFYDCTETERQALRDKITFNGMTVGRIGIINDFIREDETFIKGQIIRIGDISEDYNTAVAIASEINKGVYISK